MRSRGFLLLSLLVAFSAGCSPDSYKASADADVREILRDREETTLGYKPEVEAKTDVPDTPGKSAYAKIPLTPVAPLSPPPISPVTVVVPYGPLGPEFRPHVQQIGPGMDLYGVEAAERRAARNLEIGPPDPTDRSVKLDLFRALEYAVQHSRNYATEMEGLYLTTLNVTLQRHLFAPRPFLTTGLEFTGGQNDVNFRSAMTVTNSAGVRQRLPYGGEVVARTLVDFINHVNGNVSDGESAAVALSASVPLLRGAGMINLESLINSERQVIYEIRAFEDFRRQFTVNIASQYFNLLTRMQQLNNRRFNYATLRTLTEQSQALYEAGRNQFIDVQRARQSELSALSDLIDAQQSYQTALDTYKILLGMPIETELEVVAVELDVRVPDARVQDVIEIATKYRLDLQTARDQVDDARRGVSNAKNGLLPDLDFTANSNWRNDPGQNTARDLDNRSATYSAGLQLDIPIDRVAERNVYRRSLIQLQQAERSYLELKDRISIAARDALRAIESAQMTVQIQNIGITVAQARLENSNELLRQGKVTSREVVEAQSDLLSAQDSYFRARADLQISILEYLRLTGTLRVDPNSGALGQAMDRASLKARARLSATGG